MTPSPTIVSHLPDGKVVGHVDGKTYIGSPVSVPYADMDVEHDERPEGGCTYALGFEGWLLEHGFHDEESCWGDGGPPLRPTRVQVYEWQEVG